MTSRNFGINSGRAGPSGASGTGTSARASTPRDPHPLPTHSLRPDPLHPVTEADRNFAAGTLATVVLSLGFLIPMIAAGVILHFR